MKELDRLYENQERIDKETQESWAKSRGYSSYSEWEERRNITVAENTRKRG